MQNKVESQLLPEGFRDSLPGMAEKEYKVNSIFIEIMEMNGFSLVKPPLLEFEDSLFFLNNDREEINSFRLLDPISQKMMGLRSDITLQIARISCGTLKIEVFDNPYQSSTTSSIFIHVVFILIYSKILFL